MDDWYLGEGRVSTQRPTKRHAVHTRHHQVCDDQIGVEFEGAATVRGGMDIEVMAGEKQRRRFERAWIIIYEEESGEIGGSRRIVLHGSFAGP